jgi:hypothetical protein
MNELLKIEEDNYPPNNIPELIELLDELKLNIERKIIELIG